MAAAAGGGGPAAGGLRAVIWDVDGTLVESTRLGFEGTNAVLRANGHPEVTQAQYKEGSKYPTPQRFGFHISGEPSDPAGPGLGQQFDDLYVGQVSPDTVPFFDGMQELLRDLRAAGCRFGAVSNACTAYVRAVVGTHGMEADFEQQLGADDVPAGKPSPTGLLQCCKAMGLSPADCVYVGDAPTDGQAARNAGMRGVGVTWGSHKREVLEGAFDEVVDAIGELRVALALDG